LSIETPFALVVISRELALQARIRKGLVEALLRWLMAQWKGDFSMNWSQFDLAMTDSRYLSGAMVFRDEPRMPIQTVLDNLDDGMTPEQIAEAWQIDLRLVTRVKEFAESQRLAHSVR